MDMLAILRSVESARGGFHASKASMDLRNLRKSASKKDPLNPRKKQHLIKKSSINMVKLLADNECIKKSYIGGRRELRKARYRRQSSPRNLMAFDLSFSGIRSVDLRNQRKSARKKAR
jgi:hypothetical protein